MNPFKIATEIRAILLSSEDIKEAIGEKVFPIIAPENTVGDFIAYQRDSYKQDSTKFGIYQQVPIVNVVAISENYDRSQHLASLIYDTLSGDFADPDIHIELEDSTEDFIDNKYIQVLQFSIKNR
ncbi:DUF3168 domain-containing protein [Bacteroides finegoldii]|jgi:hypothetical protein|uniref:DUF3168 domain-containing protein n=1 Tax=Bacteroides finegoldii TaxID=338188 RepID=UPI002431BE0B|nr:DUF3168 domain-containing protein [Bacteroides finegoldii]